MAQIRTLPLLPGAKFIIVDDGRLSTVVMFIYYFGVEIRKFYVSCEKRKLRFQNSTIAKKNFITLYVEYKIHVTFYSDAKPVYIVETKCKM